METTIAQPSFLLVRWAAWVHSGGWDITERNSGDTVKTKFSRISSRNALWTDERRLTFLEWATAEFFCSLRCLKPLLKSKCVHREHSFQRELMRWSTLLRAPLNNSQTRSCATGRAAAHVPWSGKMYNNLPCVLRHLSPAADSPLQRPPAAESHLHPGVSFQTALGVNVQIWSCRRFIACYCLNTTFSGLSEVGGSSRWRSGS